MIDPNNTADDIPQSEIDDHNFNQKLSRNGRKFDEIFDELNWSGPDFKSSCDHVFTESVVDYGSHKSKVEKCTKCTLQISTCL